MKFAFAAGLRAQRILKPLVSAICIGAFKCSGDSHRPIIHARVCIAPTSKQSTPAAVQTKTRSQRRRLLGAESLDFGESSSGCNRHHA